MLETIEQTNFFSYFRVRKMLAQLTALLGSLGFLEGDKGRDFLEFIVKLCALPTNEVRSVTSNDILQVL